MVETGEQRPCPIRHQQGIEKLLSTVKGLIGRGKLYPHAVLSSGDMLFGNHDMLILHGIGHRLTIQFHQANLFRFRPEIEDQRLWLLRLETDLHLSYNRLLSFGGNREKELIVDRTEMRFPKLG